MPRFLAGFAVTVLMSSSFIAAPGIAQGFDVDRARENLRALLEGRKQLHQLTLAEQREVIELYALMRRLPIRQQETHRCPSHHGKSLMVASYHRGCDDNRGAR
jgi:hypothetical protein